MDTSTYIVSDQQSLEGDVPWHQRMLEEFQSTTAISSSNLHISAAEIFKRSKTSEKID